MSLEQTILSLVAAVEANTAAMLKMSGTGAAATATVDTKTSPSGAEDASADDTEKSAAATAAEKAAEKKAAVAAKKAAAEKAAADKKAAASEKKESAEITDEAISEVYGPLLAKTLPAETLASNKQFVATLNAHFGVAKLREVTQKDRALVIEWGKARAEDEEFEIPVSEAADEDDGV